jgi:hypothetical protein
LFFLAAFLAQRSKDGRQTHSSRKPAPGTPRHQFRLLRGTIR